MASAAAADADSATVSTFSMIYRFAMGSLFSGVGALDIGIERAFGGSLTTVFQVEINDYCRRVLARHWPDAIRHIDVRGVGSHNLPRVDILVGGYPCTDIAAGGKRAGLAGAASGLWFEYARVIGEIRPRIIIVENSAASLTPVPGSTEPPIQRVLSDMATFGYDAWWNCLRAFDVAAPHRRRDRLFVVGWLPGELADADSDGLVQFGEDDLQADEGLEVESGNDPTRRGEACGRRPADGQGGAGAGGIGMAERGLGRDPMRSARRLDEGILADAANDKTRSREALRSLQEEAREETALQRNAGGDEQFSTSKVLQSSLLRHGSTASESDDFSDSETLRQVSFSGMRVVRNDGAAGTPSSRRESSEQFPGKYRDSLCQMSRRGTLGNGEENREDRNEVFSLRAGGEGSESYQTRHVWDALSALENARSCRSGSTIQPTRYPARPGEPQYPWEPTRRVDDTDRVAKERLTALGNSVLVDQAYVVGRVARALLMKMRQRR